VSRFEKGLAPPAINEAVLERLERRHLTRELAAFLEGVVQTSRSKAS
jgi:hypothetical protein